MFRKYLEHINGLKHNWTLKILAWAFDASMLSALERCSWSCSDLKSSPIHPVHPEIALSVLSFSTRNQSVYSCFKQSSQLVPSQSTRPFSQLVPPSQVQWESVAVLPPSLMVFFHPFPSLIQIVQNIYIPIVVPASILEHRGLRKSISSVIQSTGPENSDKSRSWKRKAQGLSAHLFLSAVVAAAPRKRSNRKFMFSSKDLKRERDGGLMQSGWMMILSFYCWPNLPFPGHPPFWSSSMGASGGDTAQSHPIQKLPEIALLPPALRLFFPFLEITKRNAMRLAVEYISSILRHLTFCYL